MSETQHDHAPLGAYVLGVLDGREVAAVERHLAGCVECSREVAELAELRFEMDEVPPEAFLDGPPEGGDLLLRRTVNLVREAEEREAADWRPAKRSAKRGSLVAVAAGLVLIALGGGVILGRQTAPETVAQPPNPPAPTSSPATPGVRTVAATDAKTGASLNAAVTPAMGWVRVHAMVAGVKQGEKCLLVVKPKSGEQMVAGSWLVSSKGEQEGTSLDGSALVAPDQVESVDVVTTDGRTLVSARA